MMAKYDAARITRLTVGSGSQRRRSSESSIWRTRAAIKSSWTGSW